jgi:hypothetical protein
MRNRALNYVNFFKEFHQSAPARCANYGSTDGTPHGQAASIESLIVFSNRLRSLGIGGPIKVLDAGAGASTAFLCNEAGFEVTTMDPDQEYLQYVVNVVRDMGLRRPQVIQDMSGLMFHGCFYDYGTKERVPQLPFFANHTSLLFYVDDGHAPDVSNAVLELIRNDARWTYDGIIQQTLDEFGRYGHMLKRGVV